MVLKENCDVNKPPSYGQSKKATHSHSVKFEDLVVQTSRSQEFSNGSTQYLHKHTVYSDDEDCDDDMLSRVESVVAVAAKMKKKRQEQWLRAPTAAERKRRPLQELQQEFNGRTTDLGKKVSKLQENGVYAELRLLPATFDRGDDTSSEIQALIDQAKLLAPTQHLVEGHQADKTEETVMVLVKELTKQSIINEDAMRQISFFEQLVREKDQELEDSTYYNQMNDCANKRMLTFASERYEKQLNEQQQRVANLIKIVQRQQLGGSEFVNSWIREKCILQKELSLMKMYLNEEAVLDKKHLKRVQCAVAVTALVSAYVALAIELESFLYIAPFYFLFVFFAVV
jgi:hypothetical protein